MRCDVIAGLERDPGVGHGHCVIDAAEAGPIVPKTPPEKPDTAPPEENPPQEPPEIEPSIPGEDIPVPQFPEIKPPYE